VPIVDKSPVKDRDRSQDITSNTHSAAPNTCPEPAGKSIGGQTTGEVGNRKRLDFGNFDAGFCDRALGKPGILAQFAMRAPANGCKNVFLFIFGLS